MSTDSFLNYRIDSFEHFELIFKKAIDLFEEYGIKVESSRIDKGITCMTDHSIMV